MDVTAAIAAAVAAAATAFAAVEHRRAQRAVRRARAREQELLERLAAGLAHEIKNNLGALSLNLQLLEEELAAPGGMSGSSRARLASITRDFGRIEDVVNNFLRYAGQRKLTFAETDLNALVADLVTFIKPEAMRKGVAIDCRASGEPALAAVDAPLIKQALLNILLNALDSMAERGGTLTISAERTDGAATVAVRDTGAGISEEDLPHIFEAYYSRKHAGTGLGLAITKRIVEDHGGRIEIESEAGRGTRVVMTLPAQRAA